MNLKPEPSKVLFENNVFKRLLPDFILNFEDLKNSKKYKHYDISFRETWGLAIIVSFRKFRENEKNWLFFADSKLDISDDGIIGSFSTLENTLFKIDYSEKIEQVYLPIYFKKKLNESYNDLLIRFLKKTKLNKGDEYTKDTSLVILNDIPTQDFLCKNLVDEFFPVDKNSFLHLYFIGFQEFNDKYIKYYLCSFTNQKHRQFLNGQFELYIYSDGNYEFKIIQEISLLI